MVASWRKNLNAVFVYARIKKNNPLISTPIIDTISATVYFKEL